MINEFQNKSAGLIRATLALKQVTQTDIAEKLNLNKYELNRYLRRSIDLLPDDIEKILQELNLNEKIDEESNDDPV